MVVGDYLGRRERYSPEQLAIIDTGHDPELRLTYRAWNRRVNRLARWLRASAGVVAGDRVAILAHDGIEHLDVFHACAKLGAIHLPLNWRLHTRELAGIVRATTPRVLVSGERFAPAAAELAGDAVLVHLGTTGAAGSTSYADVLAQTDDAPIDAGTLDPEAIACLLFTGGTTGAPRGACISHRQICWNVLNTVIHDVRHDDIYLNVFPLFHTGGLFTYLSSQVVLGNTTVLVRQFDPARVLGLIARERVTIFAAVPTMYQALADAPAWADADLGSLRFCTSGGAPLPVALIGRYSREKGVRFKQGFGMTEYGPGLFALPAEDALRKAGSIGRPNFFVDVRVVDADNQPLGPNQPGELVLRGPSGCSGYWNDPAATAAAFDADGWFHTGDIVEYDDSWYFYVRDRKKDMFISGGENVYPAEVEQALYRHPAVRQCAVIGVPDARWGEAGLACVVLHPGMPVAPDALREWLRGQLAGYKVPRAVVMLDALPLSGAGKILKRELRERFRG
ncbi:MAG: AMP-binding protein [Chloroflexi bacterium]|nr:AMP-binding protein [Chloroflexota bacterium]